MILFTTRDVVLLILILQYIFSVADLHSMGYKFSNPPQYLMVTSGTFVEQNTISHRIFVVLLFTLDQRLWVGGFA